MQTFFLFLHIRLGLSQKNSEFYCPRVDEAVRKGKLIPLNAVIINQEMTDVTEHRTVLKKLRRNQGNTDKQDKRINKDKSRNKLMK